jgi:hypothetical protein
MRHNVHTKFHEYPTNHSVVIKCVQMDIASEVRLDWVRLGDAHD